MSRILRLDMANKKFRWEEAKADYAGLGGRALTSRIIKQEVPATCHPLSPANKLVVAPGILTGTTAANTGRISVGGKSPLTGGIKESNSGGLLSQKLARLGVQAIVVVVDMINARYGTKMTTADVGELGRQVLHDELSFNHDAGFTKAHDRLPEFFKENLKDPHNVTWDFTDAEIDSVLGDL